MVIIVVGYASGPTEESLTACVSSRIATHSDDPTYGIVRTTQPQRRRKQRVANAERSTTVPEPIFLAQTRRAELDDAIVKVHGMPLVAKQRNGVLTAMREEQDQMLRVIVAASESR